MDAKVVVDASVWVSSFSSDDANHNASHLWSEQYNIRGGLLVAPMLFLVEVAAAVSRRTKDPVLAKGAIRRLESTRATKALQIVPVNAVLIRTAIEVATDLQLRAGDAIYIALAWRMRIPLVTWDKEQLSKASTIVTTYTPDNYPFEEDTEEV